MITFCICLALLITAYFTYGKILEKAAGIKDTREVPSKTCFDGVDYVPLPKWKIFLIQLLNIAGLGPIFGAVLGAAYGPLAFLWITLGGIFFGAMHDFLSGFMSVKNKGASLHALIGKYLDAPTMRFISLFTIFIMVMVGAVFMSQPSVLLANIINPTDSVLESVAFTSQAGTYTWELLLILGLIAVYYLLATLLPIDTIIGRLYPIFGILMILMAMAILYAIFFQGYGARIPELTSFQNMINDTYKFPIVPMLFTTIACGAISGFHATQSPMMARCITNEKDSRIIFYGAMISESIIALIWAAIGMSFWGGVNGLNEAIVSNNGSAAILINEIANTTMPRFLSIAVMFGVVACAITSGDTAFRSARLIISDTLHLDQSKIMNRIYICLPVFLGGIVIILLLPFQAMWSYFAWANQVLAVFTLWTITSWLHINKKPMMISYLPATIMTYVCASYIFISPLMFGMANRTTAYILGGVFTILIMFAFAFRIRRNDEINKLRSRGK